MSAFTAGRNAVERTCPYGICVCAKCTPTQPDPATRAALAAAVDSRTPAEREYDEAKARWFAAVLCNNAMCGHASCGFVRAADALRAERRGT